MSRTRYRAMGIAVIAVLAALLLSALSRAHSAAQKVTCINNLREINTAVLMYADDHAQSLPYASSLCGACCFQPSRSRSSRIPPR